MKKRSLVRLGCIILIIAMLITGNASAVWIKDFPDEVYDYPYWDTSLSYEERAADLLSKMSLDEKIYFLRSRPDQANTINAIARLGVGSYIWPTAGLHGLANIHSMVQANTLASNLNPLGPDNKYTDSRYYQDGTSTSFPSPLAQGTTWNPALIQEMAKATGQQLRVYHNGTTKGLTAGGPGFNLTRDPRWGRGDESFGEDPLLQGIMGEYFVNGYQGKDDGESIVMAVPVVKHFAANNSETTRYYTSSNMTEAELREYYLKPFEWTVKKADPQGIMVAYNAINGVPNHSNPELLTYILKETWGFTGYVSSDNGGIGNLNSQNGVTSGNNRNRTPRELYPLLDGTIGGGWYGTDKPYVSSVVEAVAAWIKAGGVHDLGAGGRPTPQNVKAAIAQGLLTEDDVDKAIMMELLVRFRCGEFDRKQTSYDDFNDIKTLMIEADDLCLDIAEQAVVVVENNGVLPLAAKNEAGSLVCDYKNVAVVGRYVDTMNTTTYTCNNPAWKINEGFRNTLWTGLQKVYNELKSDPEGKITLYQMSGANSQDYTLSSEQLADIAQADLIIYVPVATNTSGNGAEFTDGVNGYQIVHGQYELGNALLDIAKTNEVPIVFNLMSINIREITKWLNEDGSFKGDALLWQTYLGDKQDAPANILFGKTNPSGRLTTTWYTYESQLGNLQNDYRLFSDDSIGYNGRTYKYFAGDVLYPFGYGLSYSSFKFGDLTLDKDSYTGDDTVTATIDVTNTSAVDGYEVVQIYVQSPNSAAANRPGKQLAGFNKIWVPAGQTVTATVTLNIKDVLSFWNEDTMRYSCDLGRYTIYAGTDCDTPVASKTFDLTQGFTSVLYNTTVVASSYFADKIGDTINTRTSASLSDDSLFKSVAAMPEGMTVQYSTNNGNVAVVDENGLITAVGDGVCLITAAVTYNGVTVADSTPVRVAADKNPWLNVNKGDWWYDIAVWLWESGQVNIPNEVGGEFNNQNEDNIYGIENSSFSRYDLCGADNGDGTYTGFVGPIVDGVPTEVIILPGPDGVFFTADDIVDSKTPVSVSVTTPNLVETLAANLNITVDGAPEGVELKAYLTADGSKIMDTETEITNGKGWMRISAAPAAGAECTVLVVGESYTGECVITIKPYNFDIWSANANVLDGKLQIVFNDDVVLKSTSGCVTIGNSAYNAQVLPDKRTIEVSAFDPVGQSDAKASIKGVKYPDLFPSYSFTFTVSVP